MTSRSRNAKRHQVDDLHRSSDQILQQVADGHIAIMESGKKQTAVILDYIDYCIILAALRYALASEGIYRGSTSFETDLSRYDHAISRYLAAEIDLETTSDMLGLSWVDLLQRFSHFGIPHQEDTFDLDDSIEELRAIRYLNFKNWV